jgi:RPA family protein
MPEVRKRETAHKLRIGDLLSGTPIVEDVPQETQDPTQTSSQVTKERFRFLELGDKKIVRVNVIANVIDKYAAEGEKKWGTLTIDDASGQIRLKSFGDDAAKFDDLSQGDTIIVIGVLRSYSGELYIAPEIIKKADPRYLLVRKLELEKPSQRSQTSQQLSPENKLSIRDEIIELIKTAPESGGISTEDIILKIRSTSPEIINSEIIKLIEDGVIYEPRPGKVRYLG